MKTSRKNLNTPLTKTHMHKFMYYSTVSNCKIPEQPKYPLTREWLNKWWYFHKWSTMQQWKRMRGSSMNQCRWFPGHNPKWKKKKKQGPEGYLYYTILHVRKERVEENTNLFSCARNLQESEPETKEIGCLWGRTWKVLREAGYANEGTERKSKSFLRLWLLTLD